MTDVVLGIDQSPTGLGVCAIPVDWDLDFRNVRSARFDGGSLKKGASALERISRNNSLALKVLDFARANDVSFAWIEQSISRGGWNIVQQAKLAGAIESMCLNVIGLALEAAHVSTVRKYLLGTLPRVDSKIATQVFTYSIPGASAALATGDEVDAFVIANWGLSELGYAGFSATKAA